MIAEVIVDIAAGETDRIYDYLCDDDIKVAAACARHSAGKLSRGLSCA